MEDAPIDGATSSALQHYVAGDQSFYRCLDDISIYHKLDNYNIMDFFGNNTFSK